MQYYTYTTYIYRERELSYIIIYLPSSMVPSKPRNFSHLVLPGTTMDLPATSEKPRPPALPWAQFTSSDPSTIPAPKVIIKQETKRRAAEPWGMRRWTC